MISYWIKDYCNYISFENQFKPARLINYQRGTIIRTNLGFNVGSEMGGLHLAVVLDKDSKRNAGSLTIVPLSSTDGKQVHERSVDLGNELFDKISNHHQKLIDSIKEDLRITKEMQDILNAARMVLEAPKEQEETYIRSIQDRYNDISLKFNELLCFVVQMQHLISPEVWSII